MRNILVLLSCLVWSCHVFASEAAQPAAKPVTTEPTAKAGSVAAAIKEAGQPVKSTPSLLREPVLAGAEAARAREAAQREEELGVRLKASLARLERANNAARQAQPKRPVQARVQKTVVEPSVAAKDIATKNWDYEGEGGPLRWGRINPAWAKCESGNRQSPIDIRDGIRVDLEPIGIDYKPARFSVLDTGHTVQVNLGAGNTMTVSGRMYELVEFHFHRPSEERINGKGFPMVVHLVHKDVDGKLAIVAVMINDGAASDLVQMVWNNLPLEKNEATSPIALIDMNQLLPVRREYYTYMGSLSTPPCNEGVLWLVMKEPIQMSSQQIAIFARLYPMNARPIQIGGGRLIKESN
ncbi:carbonic anhydrase family protein [Actimicrobium antarcticum]|uniref:carbonic anhydrase n=1 Tax=Actimicrobium antarcticum TaxID=1051899 RepID=A0ABP7TU92_9BURK